MSIKENSHSTMVNVPAPTIKPEPKEPTLVPFSDASGRENISALGDHTTPAVKSEQTDETPALSDIKPSLTLSHSTVKTEPSKSPLSVAKKDEPTTDDVLRQLTTSVAPAYFAKYGSAGDIQYTPEACLKEGLDMVKNIKSHVERLELGSKLRKDVWLREIASLETQGTPTTMIAVCGATGAGKSSILNAILDDNVVPTSGMRACTAVVTEIAYHKEKTIAADVSFLTEKEWRDELAVLLDDMIDENGQIRRTTDLRSESGVAWHKVHAVYPMLAQEKLAGMTVDQLMNFDSKISKLLGSTKKIIAKDSKEFAKGIAKYIDSKDQKRGTKKDKKNDDNGPALWPLIRQVSVRCSSEALRTGAVLVDLPGVADANAARSSIAKEYMKKCDCIWILAPITRAVDDKTAKDLLGDAFKSQLMNGGFADVEGTITFIATKCDDISCSEVIRALALEDDPALEQIQELLEQVREETNVWKAKKADAEKTAKAISGELKEIRASLTDHQALLKALEAGESYTLSQSTETGGKKKGKKRKNTRVGKGGSPKRRKNTLSEEEIEEMSQDPEAEADDDDMDVDDDDEDEDFIDDTSITTAHSDDERQINSNGNDGESDKSDDESDDESEADRSDEAEVLSIDDVKTRISGKKENVKNARERLSGARKSRKEAMDVVSALEKKKLKAQRDKNAFCSLKRSEFSRDVLKEDFRAGLKELDDAAAEKRNPNSFDPTVNLRDYASIDLPTFTVSSRDYIRLTKQVKGDGDPACFSNLDDTGVPSLQKWCHILTVKSRERSARNFRSSLRVFATSVRGYVDSFGTVSEADREGLRERWESVPEHELFRMDDDRDEDDDDEDDGGEGIDFVYRDGRLVPVFPNREDPPIHLECATNVTEENDGANGLSKVLAKELRRVVAGSVKDMQARFKEGLEDKCQAGADNAAESAVETSDTFAASMHWATYRATLRREGSWRRDLNEELIAPMTRLIASSWAQVFETDLFSSFEKSAVEAISNILKDFEDSCPIGLRDRARHQGQLCLEEVKVGLKKSVSVVSEELNAGQKDVSRCLAPNVREQLSDGYHRAMEERGTGSVARQKSVFRNFVLDNKDDLFENGAEVILERLDKVAIDVGKALEVALEDLSDKVEVGLSVLWEGPSNNMCFVQERTEAIESIETILNQLKFWEAADKARISNT